MTSNIEDVLYYGLAAALDELPPRAVGLRSHAIATEVHIEELVRALVRLHEMKGPLRVVIGRSGGPIAAQQAYVEVLAPDAAAARATTIRNDTNLLGKNRLVYLNSESCPGEAGLDVLDEVTPEQLALGFASATDLPVLKGLASHRIRRIVGRIEDAPIESLAAYEKRARETSEPDALPILGLVPATLSGARNVESLTAFTGPKLASKLEEAEGALSAAVGETRVRISSELRERGLVVTKEEAPTDAALKSALRLCKTLRRFSTGVVDINPTELCGLNIGLIRLLRKGGAVVDRLLYDRPPEGPDDGGQISARATYSEDQVVELQGSAALSASIVGVTDDLGQVELQGTQAEDSFTVKANRVDPFLVSAIQGELGSAYEEGCALRVERTESVLRGVPGPCEAAYTFPRTEFEQEPAFKRAAVQEFLESRATLFRAVEEMLTSAASEDARDSLNQLGALAVLESFPLLVAERVTDLCDAYVDSYAMMVAALSDRENLSPKRLEDWLIHLDLAFAIKDRTAQVARLLPAHPVRIARSLVWIRSGNRPPRLPPTVVVRDKAEDRLVPHALEHCYHRELAVGPSTQGVIACALAGLDQLWTTVLRESLAPALHIELLDVPDPAPAVEAMMRHCEERFDVDRRLGSWMLLRVTIANSEGQAVDLAAVHRQLAEDFAEYLDAPTGHGLTLQIQRTAAPGTQWRHLVVQGIPTPYRRLPVDHVGPRSVGLYVEYVPVSSGAIGSIEVRGEPGTEAYNDILKEILRIDTGNTRDPGDGSPSVGSTLVRGLVCNGGWPIRPEPSAELISYGVKGDDVFVVLANPDVVKREIEERLKTDLRIPSHLVAGEIEKIEQGMLQLYPCRNFLRNLLAGGDVRHLRADRALMTALQAASTHSHSEGAQALIISLDSPEGIRWARASNESEGHKAPSGTRADLLILEADEGLTRLRRLRVVELKASESAKSLESRLHSFARQPLRTKFRLDRLTKDPVKMSKEVELFRGMVWKGAGHQQLARRWKRVLTDLDTSLREGRAIDVVPECWLVPDSFWEGDSAFTRNFLTESGDTETVFYRVLAPVSEEPREMHSPPGANGQIPAVSVPVSAPPPVDSGPMPPIGRDDPGSKAPREDPGTKDDVASTQSTESPPATDESRGQPISAEATSGITINLGRFLRDGREALWLPNRTDLVDHFNVGITGTMGTGKTQLVKSLVAQLVQGGPLNVGRDRPPGILVFDYKGDYGADSVDHFPDRIGAKVLQAKNLPLNPLRLVTPQAKIDFKKGELKFVETLMSVAKGIGMVQRNELVTGVRECVRNAGIDPDHRETWDMPFPTLVDLLRHLRDNNLAKGTPQSILDDLVGLEIFSENDPDEDIDDILDDITVIDLKTQLSGMPLVIKLVIGFFMNAFYTSMMRFPDAPTENTTIAGREVQLRQLRRIVLVDEADDFMSLNLQSLKDTMQQGRSFGCGVILSTQFLTHFRGSDAPLRQLVGTWLMHRMAEVRAPEVEGLFGVTKSEAREIARELARLEKHHSYAVGLSSDLGPVDARVIRDLPFYELQHEKG